MAGDWDVTAEAPAAPAAASGGWDVVGEAPAAPKPGFFDNVGEAAKSLLATPASTARTLLRTPVLLAHAAGADTVASKIRDVLGMQHVDENDLLDKKMQAADSIVDPSYFQADTSKMGAGSRFVNTVAHVAGSVPEMVAAAPAFLADAAMTPATQAIDQGKSEGTADALGGASLLLNALGLKIPGTAAPVLRKMGAVIETPVQRAVTSMATGAAVNPVIGAAGAEADKKILEAGGHQQDADAINPLDVGDRLRDALMGVAFGVQDHMVSGNSPHELERTIYSRDSTPQQKIEAAIKLGKQGVTPGEHPNDIAAAKNAEHFGLPTESAPRSLDPVARIGYVQPNSPPAPGDDPRQHAPESGGGTNDALATVAPPRPTIDPAEVAARMRMSSQAAQAPRGEAPAAPAPVAMQEARVERPAAPVEPAVPAAPAVERAPFQTPDEHTRATFAAKAAEHGVTPDVAEKLAPTAPVDRTTGFVDGRQGALDTTIERAQAHTEQTGEPAVYVSGDIANLGGLNKHFASKQADADVHYRAMADIMHDELRGTGGDVVPMRTGGDEVGAVVVNADKAAVDAALDRARSRITEYAQANGLDTIPHKESGRAPGVGMHFGSAEIGPGVRVKDILDRADAGIDISRNDSQRASHVTAIPTETRGAGAPEGQPAGTAGSPEAPRGGIRPQDRAADAAKPAEASEVGEPPRSTSTKNEVTDRERVAEGREPREHDAPQSNEATLEKARADLASKPERGAEVVEKLKNAGVEGITVHDEAMLMAHKVDVRKRRDAAAERSTDASLTDEQRAVARREYDDLSAQVNEIDQAAYNGGREWGRLGQLRQRMLREDFSFEAMERKARIAHDRPLTPEELSTVKAQAKKIAQLQEQLDQAAARANEAEARTTFVEQKKQIVKEGRAAAGKQRTRSDRLQRMEARANEARARLRAKLGVAHSGVDPGMFADAATIGAYHLMRGAEAAAVWAKALRDDLGDKLFKAIEPRLDELRKAAEALVAKEGGKAEPTAAEVLAGIDKDSLTSRDIAALVRAHIIAGTHGMDPVMKAVHSDIESAGIAMSEREVRQLYSDYGKATFPNREAVAAEARELRRLVRLQESITRLNEGLAPLKSGPQRDKATQAIREKQAELLDLLKKQESKFKASPEKLAGYQDARRTALKNAIADLEKRIATGERPMRQRPPELDAENKALKARRDELQAELDAIDNPPGYARNAAEKAALRKRLKDVNDKLAGKTEPAKQAEHRVDDAEHHALQDELERAQAQLRDTRLEAGARAGVQAKIADLLQRLAGKPKPEQAAPKADSAEVVELKRIRDELRTQLDELERPPEKSPEARYQAARGKSLQTMLDRINSRLQAGDFAPSQPRVDRELTAENQAIAFKLSQAKAEFARQQFEAEMARRPKWKKVLGAGTETLNTARAIMTSLDLSAVLRQGAFIGFGHPLRAVKSIGPMLRAFKSAEAEHAINAEIASRPNARLYKQYGLELTDAHHHSLSKMEEAFMSRWIDRLPKAVGGGLVRGSNRAYTTFLNKLRADSFDAMAATLGKTQALTKAEGEAIASYINIATGRGNIGKHNRAAVGLNTVFFAPRLVASRFQLLAGTPMYGGTARTRTMVATEYARFLTGAAVVYGLAAMATDEDKGDGIVTFDPRSTDFGRIKIGNTYIDPLAGLAQNTVLLSRMATGEKISATGKLSSLDASKAKFGSDTSFTVLTRFLRTKLAPVPGALVDLREGKDVTGEDVTPGDVAGKLVQPMSMQNVADIMQDGGVPQGTAIEMLNLLGMGVQYREPREKKPHRSH